MISQGQMLVIGVIWVGGFGFFFFTNPQAVLRVARQEPTVKRLRRIRFLGAIELGIVFLSLVLVLVTGFIK